MSTRHIYEVNDISLERRLIFTALLRAVFAHNKDTTEYILAAHGPGFLNAPNITKKDGDPTHLFSIFQWLIIHCTVNERVSVHGDITTHWIQYLLPLGADPTIVDSRGCDALTLAVLHKRHDVVKHLLESGRVGPVVHSPRTLAIVSDPDAPALQVDHPNNIPHTSLGRHLTVTSDLASTLDGQGHPVSPHGTAMRLAFKRGMCDVTCARLLRACSTVHSELGYVESNGVRLDVGQSQGSLLMQAAIIGFSCTASAILSKLTPSTVTRDPHAELSSPSLCTPFHYAIRYCDRALCTAMVRSGAHPDIRNTHGYTPSDMLTLPPKHAQGPRILTPPDKDHLRTRVITPFDLYLTANVLPFYRDLVVFPAVYARRAPPPPMSTQDRFFWNIRTGSQAFTPFHGWHRLPDSIILNILAIVVNSDPFFEYFVSHHTVQRHMVRLANALGRRICHTH